MRYFDDFQPGEVIELGSYQVPREEILAFARQFDPQPFHIDEEAARRSIFTSTRPPTAPMPTRSASWSRTA